MKTILKISVLLALVANLSFATAIALPSDFISKASPKVKEIVIKNKLEVVEYDYILKAIGDGTRKNANAIIIDARPMKKYQASHIPSSLALPDTKFDTYYSELLGKVAKDKEIIIYCGGYKCAKSAKVAIMLAKKGHTNLKIYIAGMPEWKTKNYVEIDTNIAKAIFDKRSSALFIDARPYGKFAGSTIIGAMGVPDTKFKDYVKYMPTDKKASIIPFCGGYNCHKSHVVAKHLMKMGYTNVKVYAAGFPAWKKAKFPTTGGGVVATTKKATSSSTMSKSGVIKKGADTGTVDGKWFKENLYKLPNSITLIDVRDEKDFNAGTIAGAKNIHAEKLSPKELAKALPKSGDVVFFCGSGARAMEAREFLIGEKYPQLDRIWYFDAEIECDKNNKCKILPNDPIGI